MAIKVVLFNGSPRKRGNTFQALEIVAGVLETEDIDTEIVQLADLELNHCKACYKCAAQKDGHCHGFDDDLNLVLDKIVAAEGVILGSPTFFAGMSSRMKALVDRAGLVGKVNGDLYKHKVGAAVVVARRQGACVTYNQLNLFFGIQQMILVGSSYWNLALGRDPGDIKGDEEGITTLENLGKNFAWILKKAKASG
ncbi:MAG: flavodoxin family protein [Promethearchaeota archaeon]